jgi:hypothetical protein
MHSGVVHSSIGLTAFLCASQAIAEDWIKLGTSDGGAVWSIDKDTIERGSDGLVYFTDTVSATDGLDTSDEAVDCERRIEYLLKINSDFGTDWREYGHPVAAGSAMDAVLKYVCANAR